ncbi:MAG: mannose-1-phosphate guanylyltransferase [Bacteroidales bacterium]|nr:mannose-1-phosphate guanylyltransferase [Bacteroidales bacterium]
MSESHRYCVILAGGIGARFWPVSREDRPKQFLQLTHDEGSFLQETYARMSRSFPEGHIFVITLARYRDMVLEQLPGLPDDHVLIEPYSRNTAPSVALATYTLLNIDPEATVLVTPSDHIISDKLLFDKTVSDAIEYASRGDALVTLGIVPTRPDANFGYIQVTGGAGAHESGKPLKAKTFTEKPDPELAQVFLDSGEFLWNSGIFVWKAGTVRAEMERCCPEITRLWQGWEKALNGPDAQGFVERIYADIPRISIDYALMEKSDRVWILPAKFGWTDIGNWESLYDYLSRHDRDGNSARTAGPLLMKDNANDIIYSTPSGKLTVLRGLRDYLVIDTDDVLMVCPRDDKKIKDLIAEVAMPNYEEYR